MAPATKFVKLDSPYIRFTKGASGKYAGEIVNTPGTVMLRCVRVMAVWFVESTIPGRILPTTEPMPGKFDAAPKFPLPPVAAPRTLVNGGAIRLPVKPKFGPVAPMNGNCRNGCPPEFPDGSVHGGPIGRNKGVNPVNKVEPPVRIGGEITAGPTHSVPTPNLSWEFGK